MAYLLYFNGISGLTETSKVPVLCSVELVVATLIGVLFFGENFPPVSIAGTVMILASILMMNRGTER